MDWPRITPVVLFGLLSVILLIRNLATARGAGGRSSPPGYLGYLWAFLLVFAVADWVSFTVAVWITALISFRALREYFSLMDWRPTDRWAVLVAYLAIPFMIYLIQIDWYGFFIVSIPVYVFLVIPFLVALGDRAGRIDRRDDHQRDAHQPDARPQDNYDHDVYRQGEGTVMSIGAIDFGVFFCVYCLGHIAYLAYFSTWMAMLLVLSVAGSNAVMKFTASHGRLPGYLLSNVVTLALALLLMTWTGIPLGPSLFVGVLIPVLVQMGGITISALERDLGISAADLEPGRGRVLDAVQPYCFVAPIVFHYLRWTMKFGELVIGRGG